MIHELRTAREAAQVTPQYLILNACRNIAYLDEGKFYSKIDGGRWFVNHHRDLGAEIVEAAIIRQAAADEAVAIDLTSAIPFAVTMADRLEKSLG
jgi:streptomycin 3"-adenylyltransferase